MNKDVGQVTIGLTFDGKSLDKSQKDVETKTKAWASTLGSTAKLGGKLIAGGLIAGVTAVEALGTASVKAYGEFEQLAGGMQKIFDGVDYSQIAADAQDAYRTMNISASEYMANLAGVGATFAQTMGDQKGYDTAKAGMQALADYASGTGKSVDLLMEKYQAITRSTSSYLSIADQFAGLLPQTTDGFLKQAQASGYLSDEYTKLSQVPVDEYQQALTQMLQDGVKEMGLADNTAAETENTITGSINATKAALQNLITGLGDENADLDLLIGNVGKSAEAMINNLIPAFEKTLNGVGKFLGKALPKVLQRIPQILANTIPTLLDSAVGLFTDVMKYLPEIVQSLQTLIATVATQLIAQLPTLLQGLINGILGTIKTLTNPENLRMMMQVGIQLLMAIVQAIPEIVVALSEALPDIIANIIDFLTSPETIMMMITAAVQLFMGIVQAIPRILGALIQAFGRLFGNLWEAVKKHFGEFVGKFGEFITGIFKGAINGVLGFIENFVNMPIDILNGFIKTINDAFGAIGVNLGHINRIKLPRLAQGGLAVSATTAIIGEAGKEAVIPLEQNTGNWAGLLASTLADEFERQDYAPGGGITVYMQNTINNKLDINEVGREMMQSIRRAV